MLQPHHDPIIKNPDKIKLKINHSSVRVCPFFNIKHKFELSTGKLKLFFFYC